MAIKIALAQINTKLGEVQANLNKHLKLVKGAIENHADLLIFPELSLSGYSLQDLVPEVAIKPSKNDPVYKQLLQASKDIDIMVGFVEEDQRHRFYISASYLSDGETLHTHRKVYLPTYGIFDEKRFLAAGDKFRAFNTKFGRIGMLICEDFWHISSPYLLWLDGADIFLMQSASPGRGITEEQIGSSDWVENINRSYAGLFTSFFAHANRVGFEDGLYFWGGATLYNPDGRLVAKGPYYEEALTYAEIDPAQIRRTRIRLPLLRDERQDITLKELERMRNDD